MESYGLKDDFKAKWLSFREKCAKNDGKYWLRKVEQEWTKTVDYRHLFHTTLKVQNSK